VFVTNHALAGAALGLVLRRPVAAFAAGVVSHVAMDMVHHWGEPGIDWESLVRLARVDGTVGLAVTGAVAALSPGRARVAALAGLAGACIVDMDKAGRHLVGRSPFPAAVDRFHCRIQNESPAGHRVEALWAAGLAAGLVALMAAARSAPATR
jgi:hypothetical protein